MHVQAHLKSNLSRGLRGQAAQWPRPNPSAPRHCDGPGGDRGLVRARSGTARLDEVITQARAAQRFLSHALNRPARECEVVPYDPPCP